MRQILEGLVYLHENNVIHRDLKGANILVSEKGIVKLADFGLSKIIQHDRNKDNTIKVVTLWYRAPELLLGMTNYDYKSDVWSAAIFFLELFLKKPLFCANNEAQQLEIIMKFWGTPTELNFTEYDKLDEEVKSTISKQIYQNWLLSELKMKTWSFFDDEFFDLISKMLVVDPKRRIRAQEALDHKYFIMDPPAWEPQELPLLNRDSHDYMVKMEKRGKNNPDLQDKLERDRRYLEKLKKDNDNGFIYRRPPELKEGEIDESKPVDRHSKKRKHSEAMTYVNKEENFWRNPTRIGRKVDYSSYLGGSMLSASEGINKKASISEAGGDLGRFRAKYWPETDPDKNDPETFLKKKYKKYTNSNERELHERRKRAYEHY
jgi:serine/threonine protein kinase